jgi:phage terminase small subunit
MSSKALTPREQLLLDEYMVDHCQAKAALRAGFSPRSAKQTAHVIFKRPHFAAALRKAIKEQQERTKLTADQVLLDLKRYGDKAEKKGDLATATTTRVWLGKNHRLWTERHIIRGKLTLEELVKSSMDKDTDDDTGAAG